MSARAWGRRGGTAVRTALGLACVGTVACSGTAPPSADPAPPPSVLVVVLDTVRADHTALGGQAAARTPQLAAIAAAGTTWTRATAPGTWTWPSHASLFTGVPPWVHGAHGARREEGLPLKDTLRVTPLRTDLPTLAERFSEAGYRCEAAVANRLLSAPLGLTRGFDPVFQDPGDAAVVDAAIGRMAGDEPLLLFVNLMTAHSPYHPVDVGPVTTADLAAAPWTEPFRSGDGLSFHTTTPSGEETFARGDLLIPPEGLRLLDGLYSGEVVSVDQHLNRLLTAWQAARPHAVVAVTSDHGEYLGEHRLLGHSASTYSQVTHVPMVLAGPGIPAGVSSDRPVQLHDLYGTLLELAGVEATPHSLARPDSMPAERDITSAAWVRPHLAETVGGRLSVPWRTLARGDDAVVVYGDTVELYDLRTDPHMLRDRSTEHPDQARAMADAARTRIPMTDDVGGLQVDPTLIEQLEQLGYIQ